jgi:calcium-translocating P-type ATPase
LWDSFKEAINDKILFLIAVFAVLSIITGMIYNARTGWIEGVSILLSLLVLVAISSLNDWSKDKTFVRLQGYARDENLPTVRGKIGSMQSLNIWELVVGDVVVLSAGDKVPADCLVVESANLEVDQSKVDCIEEPDERGIVPKGENDPFLYAESYIRAGSAKAVVTCVGRHSTRGTEGKKLDTSSKTPLENKLYNLSKTFTYLGIIAAAIILAVTMVMLFIGTGFSEHDDKGKQFLKRLIENMTVALIIIIVSIPEGLPMTVAISLSYSVIDMFNKDKILVRDLTAPEKMGEVTEILTGKTGTMTTEEMRIESCFAQNCHINMFRPDTLLNCAYNDDTVDIIKESILWNTQAHIEMTENAFYVPEGNGTEVSLIKWLQGAEIPVHKLMLEREGRIKAWIPFDTKLKRSIIAIEHPQVEGTVRVYIKGAPETVVNNCVAAYDQTGNKIAFDQEAKNYALTEIMRDCMTKKGFRAIAFSFRDFPVDEFAGLGNFQSDETISQLESNQTFVAMVGMKDPPRDRVKQVVQYAVKGRINIRMISGDNLDTAKAVACDAGILTPAEFDSEASIETQRLYAMDANDFREQVGPIERGEDEDGKPTFRLGNQQAFN